MNRTSTAMMRTLTSLAIAATGTALAGELELDWWTIDGGGAMFTTGGSFELSGTIGQADAGMTMTGGDIEVVGGFWPAGIEEAFCFGDFDGDNDVDLADLANLLGSYGQTEGMTYEDGDLDGDGDVDLADLAALLGVYGTTCP
jgi:hypothetical protein